MEKLKDKKIAILVADGLGRQSVVVDDGLITSRTPDDLPEFNKAMIKAFGKV